MSTTQTDNKTPVTIRETTTRENFGPVPEQDPGLWRDKTTDTNTTGTSTTTVHESKGIVGSVVDAAKSAAHRVREAFSGDDTNRLHESPTAPSDFSGGSTAMASSSGSTTSSDFHGSSSGKSTTEKIKDTAYDAKHKVQDTAHDIKNKVQDTAHDIKNKSKDVGHDVKNKSKDVSHDTRNKSDTYTGTSLTGGYGSKDTSTTYHDRTMDTGHDYSTERAKDTSLSSDSDIAADSNKQRLRDIKEKVMDAAKAPIVMAQTMAAAGKEKLKEKFSSDQSSSTATTTQPSGPDAFSKDYHPGPAQYQTDSTTNQAKTKLATAAANTADKAEDWIATGKDKLNQQADKAQVLASDAKHKANAKAQESGKEPANDTRYYSSSHTQTY